jgi:hypothetical protein
VVIIIVLKPDLGVDPKQDVNHEIGGSTWVNVKIKVIIIIILKSDLRVNPKQGSSHGLGGSTLVDLD